MMGFDAVLRLIEGLDPGELHRWIAERWVRPESTGETYVFHDIDVARVRLILELRRDLAIDEEALPVVLQLLDQVYALRRRLHAIHRVLEEEQPGIRDSVRQRLAALLGESEPR